jgi:hypothetical protein
MTPWCNEPGGGRGEYYDLNQIYAVMGTRMGFGLELDHYRHLSAVASKNNKSEILMEDACKQATTFESINPKIVESTKIDHELPGDLEELSESQEVLEKEFGINEALLNDLSFFLNERVNRHCGLKTERLYTRHDATLELEPSVIRLERTKADIASPLTQSDKRLIFQVKVALLCIALEGVRNQMDRCDLDFDE